MTAKQYIYTQTQIQNEEHKAERKSSTPPHLNIVIRNSHNVTEPKFTQKIRKANNESNVQISPQICTETIDLQKGPKINSNRNKKL